MLVLVISNRNLGTLDKKFDTIYANTIIAHVEGSVTTSNLDIPGYIKAANTDIQDGSGVGNWLFQLNQGNTASSRARLSIAQLQVGTTGSGTSTSLANRAGISTGGAITGTSLSVGIGNISGGAITGTSLSINGTPLVSIATDSNYGGIKTGYTATNKNYAVKLDNGNAYVNVPWTDTNTTYIAGAGLTLSSNNNAFSLNDSEVSASTSSTNYLYFRSSGSTDIKHSQKLAFNPRSAANTCVLYLNQGGDNPGSITYDSSTNTFTI